MIVQLSADSPPTLVDLDRLDRLHAECAGPIGDMRFDETCVADDDGQHVWLDVAAARSIGVAGAGADDVDYGTRFDAMIAYAASKGWLDDASIRVRAHIQSPTA